MLWIKYCKVQAWFFVLCMYLFSEHASKENKGKLSFPSFEVIVAKRLWDKNTPEWIVLC